MPFLLIILSLGFLAGAVYTDQSSSKFALFFLIASYPLYLLVKKVNAKSQKNSSPEID
jgi:APA family basic amino acid/polyamine antiporter